MKAWQTAFVLAAAGLCLHAFSMRVPPASEGTAMRGPASSSALPSAQPTNPPSRAAFGALPVVFVENRGQVRGPARFVTGWPHAPAWITATGITLELSRCDETEAPPRQGRRLGAIEARAGTRVHCAHVALIFEGADRGTTVVADEPASSRYSYFLGNDPTRWRTNVPQFDSVQFDDVYPGIDVVYYGHEAALE